MIQFNAHFDGKNLCPEEAVSLPQDVILRVTVDEPAEAGPQSQLPQEPNDLFQRLEDEFGLIEGPSDWAAEHDHYLYGTPKHGDCKNSE